ncbi:MAG TPA: hypothetical protein VGM39_23025 [Kofleriaceae bacterium]
MSQDGVFLIRGASPKVVMSILEGKSDLNWYTDTQLDPEDTTSTPGVLLAVPDYFPADAEELENYRKRLLTLVSSDELKQLMGDPRGMFVFDPMIAEEKGAFSYDEIVEACSEDIGNFGLWFDPFRPASEQTVTFAEREVIEVTSEMVEEIERALKAPAKKAAKKAKTKKPAAKAKPKKPAAKAKTKKPAGKASSNNTSAKKASPKGLAKKAATKTAAKKASTTVSGKKSTKTPAKKPAGKKPARR